MLSQAPKPLINVIYRDPFTLGAPDVWQMPNGATIHEIIKYVRLDNKADFFKRGTVAINGHVVHRDCWHLVRPKADAGAIVTLHMPVRGGGAGGQGGGGKQAVAVIAALAITIASAGVAGGAAAGILGASFGAGTLGAALLGAGISFAGSILVSSLTSAPTRNTDASDTRAAGGASLSPASIQGNALQANAPIPRVIGTRRVYPPFAAEPTPEYIGQDEIFHALYCLAGPHELTKPRFGETSYDVSESGTDIDLQLYDGRPNSAPIVYPQRYSKTFSANVEMSVHGTDAQNLAVAVDPLPVWHGTNTADAPDETWLHFSLYGMTINTDPTAYLRIPIRIRMRLRGSATWRYLPEFHYKDNTQSQRRFQVKLRFGEPFLGPYPLPSTTRGFVEARKLVPAQNVTPLGVIWEADSYFSSGAGNDIYNATTASTTNVRHVDLSTDAAIVYLDDTWPRGVYEIEIKRGATFRDANFTSSTYVYEGNVIDFYSITSTGILPLTRAGLFDRLDFVRSVSVKNSPPVQQANLSLMYVYARNRQVGNFSVQAAGYVSDLDANTPAQPSSDHVLYCTFDGSDGSTTMVDLSPKARTLTAVANAQLDTADKKHGTASYLSDGTGDRIDMAASTDFNFAANEPFTISTWVKCNSAAMGGAAVRYIMSRHNATGDQRSFFLAAIGFNVSAPYVQFSWSTDGTSTNQVSIASAANTFPVNAWTHIAVTRDEFGVTRLFINGVLHATGSGALSAAGNFASSATLEIGERTSAAGSWFGWIDQLEVIKGACRHVATFDPDGTGTLWNQFRTTSNPAPHLRDMLVGTLNFNPMPELMLDDTSLAEWRNVCETEELTCNLVVEGSTLFDALRIVASCGYARPYNSEVWGVIRDYDRSAESPVQIFTPRNSRGWKWQKAFPKLPDGLRVNFTDQDAEYSGRQMVVYRNGANQLDARTEQITYDGLVNRADIIARAKFDLAQSQYRSAVYNFEAPVESIVCRRGSLIGVAHDLLTAHTGSARIVDVIRNASGFVIGLILDSEIETFDSDDMLSLPNMLAVADMLAIGKQSAVAIRHIDGTTSTHQITGNNGSFDSVTLASAYDDDDKIAEGCLLIVGQYGQEYKRLIVAEISPGKDLTATITAVDEAPEIWS